MTRGTGRLVAALLGVALVGWGPGQAVTAQSAGASPAPSGPAASTSPPPSVIPSPIASPPPPVVRVMDRGARPRAVRRYTLVAGDVRGMVMEVRQDVRTRIGGGVETEFEMPTIRYLMTTTVLAVDAQGAAEYRLDVTAVSVVPDPDAEEPLDADTIAQLDEALAPLVGLSVTARLAPDGTVSGIAVDTAGLDPMIAQQLTGITERLAQQAMALPGVPIGVGARWVATSRLTANGITFSSRQTLTLKAAHGTRLTIESSARQSGIPGPVALPGLPEGYTAQLEELDGETRGRSVVDLTTVVAPATGSGTVRVRLSATDGTEVQTTTSTVETEFSVRPAGPTSAAQQ